MDAAQRIEGKAVRTPLLESAALNRETGGRLLIKAETLQRTGSFKFRGAYNRISRLDEAVRDRGVVAYSSGNHAQAVAAVAGLLGMPATIVMPSNAPAIKIGNTRAFGATVVTYDRYIEVREDIAAGIVADTGAALIPPYDDPLVIAGQGTVGLEIAQQAGDLGVRLDAVLVPCSGGGLVSGVALALAELCPDTEIIAVEPEGFDDTARSLASGRRETIAAGAHSICDALLVPTPGAVTFPINQQLLAGAVTVDDDQVRHAMAAAFRHLKLVVEPGGAVALAAITGGAYAAGGKTVAVVCSGGNVDAEIYREAIG
ncbi:MAG: threonine ammonia-lyase [Alphaproteobacteria bacterium]